VLGANVGAEPPLVGGCAGVGSAGGAPWAKVVLGQRAANATIAVAKRGERIWIRLALSQGAVVRGVVPSTSTVKVT
jgi:hypothetical protein